MCVAELFPAAPSEQDYTGLAHNEATQAASSLSTTQ